MMTHSEEKLPTGELGPSQPEKQVSVCQITSFRSAAFEQMGKQEHTLGFVRKSSSLTVSLKARTCSSVLQWQNMVRDNKT